MYKPSKNPKVLELTQTHKSRHICLDVLRPIKTEDGGKFCPWCVDGKVHKGSAKYCSDPCRQSAQAWAYPQKEEGLYFLLKRQGFKCNSCQYDYNPLFLQIETHYYSEYGYTLKEEDSYLHKFSWYFTKLLKSKAPNDRRPEVDHIIPVHKGGTTIGLDNHQAVCNTCHKHKTAKDLSK